MRQALRWLMSSNSCPRRGVKALPVRAKCESRPVRAALRPAVETGGRDLIFQRNEHHAASVPAKFAPGLNDGARASITSRIERLIQSSCRSRLQCDQTRHGLWAEMVEHGGQAIIWQTPDGSMSGIKRGDEQLPVVSGPIGCASDVGQVLLKLSLWDELCVDGWREGDESDEDYSFHIFKVPVFRRRKYCSTAALLPRWRRCSD